MNTVASPETQADIDQREALEESEKEAAREWPENFRDEENDEKVVEIGPDMTDDPIHGIDPDEKDPPKKAPAKKA